MILEESHVLLLKRLHPVMFHLSLNIPAHRGQFRLPHREGPVAGLPCERASTEGLMNPFRTSAFHIANQIGETMRRSEAEQQVDMIQPSADAEGRRVRLPEDSAQHCVRSGPPFLRQPRFAIPGGKHHMDMQTGMGGWHGEKIRGRMSAFNTIPRAPAGARFVIWARFPGVVPRARATPGYLPAAPPGRRLSVVTSSKASRRDAGRVARGRAAPRTPGANPKKRIAPRQGRGERTPPLFPDALGLRGGNQRGGEVFVEGEEEFDAGAVGEADGGGPNGLSPPSRDFHFW